VLLVLLVLLLLSLLSLLHVQETVPQAALQAVLPVALGTQQRVGTALLRARQQHMPLGLAAHCPIQLLLLLLLGLYATQA
jgi:hypothetical protein